MRTQAMPVRDALEVFQQDRLGGEMLGPDGGLEGVGIDVVGAIHPATRVGVLEPGAAHLGIFVHDLERHAGLFEPKASQQAGHARADHKHVQLARGRGELRPPLGIARAFALERHLIDQEGGIVIGNGVRAGDEGHDPPHQLGAGRRRGGFRVHEGLERGSGVRANLILHLG